MGELIEALKGRLGRTDTESKEALAKSSLVTEVLKSCEAHIITSDDEYTFEVVSTTKLVLMVGVLENPAITSLYEVAQINETMFVARMRPLEL